MESEGENTMTGRHRGVVTLLLREANVLRFWCPPHQVDLVVQDATNKTDSGHFYKTAHGISLLLRKKYPLLMAMGAKYPKNTIRWLALKFLFIYCCRTGAHFLAILRIGRSTHPLRSGGLWKRRYSLFCSPSLSFKGPLRRRS